MLMCGLWMFFWDLSFGDDLQPISGWTLWGIEPETLGVPSIVRNHSKDMKGKNIPSVVQALNSWVAVKTLLNHTYWTFTLNEM